MDEIADEANIELEGTKRNSKEVRKTSSRSPRYVQGDIRRNGGERKGSRRSSIPVGYVFLRSSLDEGALASSLTRRQKQGGPTHKRVD